MLQGVLLRLPGGKAAGGGDAASREENATQNQKIRALVSSPPMKWAHHLTSRGCDPFNHKTQEVGPELEFLPAQ